MNRCDLSDLIVDQCLHCTKGTRTLGNFNEWGEEVTNGDGYGDGR